MTGTALPAFIGFGLDTVRKERSMRRLPRPCALLIAPILALLAGTVPVWAHPMGNFSINHYTSITVGRDGVRVLYIVDMAEIQTFKELGELNAAHSARLTPAQRRTYLAGKARSLGAGLQLAYDGRPLRLSLRADDLLFPPGAGGLPTERIYLVLEAALPRGAGTLSYQDSNFPDRAGWKEIVAGNGGRVLSSTASATSRSRALTVYPSNATSSPPQDLSAVLAVGPWSGAVGRALPAPSAAIREAEAPLLGQNGSWSALEQRLSVKGAPAGSTAWAHGCADRAHLPQRPVARRACALAADCLRAWRLPRLLARPRQDRGGRLHRRQPGQRLARATAGPDRHRHTHRRRLRAGPGDAGPLALHRARPALPLAGRHLRPGHHGHRHHAGAAPPRRPAPPRARPCPRSQRHAARPPTGRAYHQRSTRGGSVCHPLKANFSTCARPRPATTYTPTDMSTNISTTTGNRTARAGTAMAPSAARTGTCPTAARR